MIRALSNSSLRSSASFKSTSVSVNLLCFRTMSDASKSKSDSEWRAILTPEQVCSTNICNEYYYNAYVQFRVLRLKGTESPGTGEYEHNKATGVYACAACNTPLYKSNTKFDSGCGWPAFYDGEPKITRHGTTVHETISAIPGAVSRHEDSSLGMVRTEITCTACGGHLGHVFKGEGFNTPSSILRIFPSAGKLTRLSMQLTSGTV